VPELAEPLDEQVHPTAPMTNIPMAGIQCRSRFILMVSQHNAKGRPE
jgi:hypothetical protein